MFNPFRRLRAALNRHPFSAESVDAFLADGRGTVEMTAPNAVRDVTPIYDGLVAEKLADQRAVMAPLLSTEELALLAHDGKVDADLYEDMLDVLCARAMGADFWDILDAEAQSIGGDSDV